MTPDAVVMLAFFCGGLVLGLGVGIVAGFKRGVQYGRIGWRRKTLDEMQGERTAMFRRTLDSLQEVTR